MEKLMIVLLCAGGSLMATAIGAIASFILWKRRK